MRRLQRWCDILICVMETSKEDILRNRMLRRRRVKHLLRLRHLALVGVEKAQVVDRVQSRCAE